MKKCALFWRLKNSAKSHLKKVRTLQEEDCKFLCDYFVEFLKNVHYEQPSVSLNEGFLTKLNLSLPTFSIQLFS